jgi:hypothetical protein
MGRRGALLVGLPGVSDGLLCYVMLLWSRSCGVSEATMIDRGWFAEYSVGAKPA